MKIRKEIKQYIECDLAITGATLLSIEEAEQLPLELRKYYNWWWLRSPGDESDRAANVLYSGSIYDHGDLVDGSKVVIRPALQIKNLNSITLKIGDIFEFGGKTFKIISDNLAFCLTDIGEHCFRKHWESKYANDYAKSDAKKYIDNWFNDIVKLEVESKYNSY